MRRKVALISLAVVLVFASATMAWAKSNVADTTKKGSLLVFPKIETNAAPVIDTYIFIGNDNSLPVSVKCYWMDNNQNIEDFQFTLTANQPIYFSARTGQGDALEVPPFAGVGSLVCFAVTNGGDAAIKFNHLYGSALIVNDSTNAVLYNAYSFAAPGDPATAKAGQLPLDNFIYDACPQYLVANFLPATDTSPSPVPILPCKQDITLLPCWQDLRQDRTPTCTKAKFDVWNENEVKFTGAYQCFKCFLEEFLHELGTDRTQRGPGFGGDKFTFKSLHTIVARFRVQGIASTVCDGKIRGCSVQTRATPLLGLLLCAQDSNLINNNNAKVVLPFSGVTPFGAGQDNTGLIQWDPAGPTPEAPRR